MRLRTRRTAFWDGVAIGTIKGHAFALFVIAVVGPLWVTDQFGLGWGCASAGLTYGAIRVVVWMFDYADRFDRAVSRETP